MRHLSLRVLVYLLALVLARPAFAVRTEFMATLGKQRVADATVCFFPATADDGFFAKFLSSGDVRCLPADQVIDMPVGHWNIYVDHAPLGYTSNHPTFQTGDSESEEDKRAYRSVGMKLFPAGTVTFRPEDLGGGRGAIYVHTANPAVVRPVRRHEDGLLAPSETEVLPFVVDVQRIVRIGRMTKVPHRGSVEAAFPAREPGKRHVVALMRLPERHRGEADAFQAPEVFLLLPDGRKIKPLFSPRNGPEIDRSLMIFESVPAGAANIIAGGKLWQPRTFPVKASDDAVQTLEENLLVEPAGTATVHWTVPAARRPPCRWKPEELSSAAHTIRLQRCSEDCQLQAERMVDEPEGQLDFESLPPGKYRVELASSTETRASDLEVMAGSNTSLSIALPSIVVSGSVTSSGTALPSDLVFATGTATTDDAGHYTATLREAPGLDYVTVLPCDGSAVYQEFPDIAIEEHSIFDIDVPTNQIVVSARNLADDAPLANVTVRVAALSERNGDPTFHLDASVTDAEGITQVRRLSAKHWQRVCGYRSGFDRTCADDLEIANDEKRELVLRMPSRGRFHGLLKTEGEIVAGILYWVTPQGATTEMAHLAADGRFRYNQQHGPEEHVVFLARDRPLTAFRPVPQSGEGWELHLPVAPVQAFSITSQLPSARLALEVGPWLISEEVFSRYQIMHGEAASLNGGRTVNVHGVAMTGPIAVLAGPATSYLPPNLPPTSNLSSLPHFRATFVRIPVEGPRVSIPAE